MSEQNFNLHTHTLRCGHAVGLDSQYIESAIKAGFKVLGFSEHIPFAEINTLGDRMFLNQKDEYISTMRSLQEQYKNEIDIKIGFEVEYIEDKFDYIMDLKKDCDYMILGQHLKYIGYEYDCYCSDEDVFSYVGQIESALEKNFITYIAHPDYFLLGRREFSDVCVEAAHRIAKASLHYDIPLEVNLNGFHYGKKEYQIYNNPGIYEERYPYPFREFWEIIASHGCKVLYGYDAHSPISFLEPNRKRQAKEILNGLSLLFIESIELK